MIRIAARERIVALQEKTMTALNELRKAARAARKRLKEAEVKYGKDWEILLDARDKEQRNPASAEAQAAHKEAIRELNKDRRTNDGLINEWLKLSAEARAAGESVSMAASQPASRDHKPGNGQGVLVQTDRRKKCILLRG